MLHSLKERFDREEEGFTLIELMVVVLIIAILLAIAIPTFLGARDSANARAAQSNLRNALTAEQTYWTNNQAWDATGAGVQAQEPALKFGTAAVTPGNGIELAADGTNGGIVMTAAGQDGNCYSIDAINQAPSTGKVSAGTYYYQTPGTGTGSATSCGSPAAPTAQPTSPSAAANAGSWSTSF
jgi:type IV pilus assembly protein PilA